MKIFKYPLMVTDRQIVSLPRGGRFLSVQNQSGVLTAWVVVDEDLPKEDREILIHGTGQPLGNLGSHYLGTVQMGMYVWHVFEA